MPPRPPPLGRVRRNPSMVKYCRLKSGNILLTNDLYKSNDNDIFNRVTYLRNAVFERRSLLSVM